MASEIQGANTLTLLANADLIQYTFVAPVTGASTTTATTGASGVKGIGVVQNAPESGKAATIWLDGQSKVIAGAAIVPGQYVISDANGRAIPEPSTNHAGRAGLALSAADAAADVVSVRLL